MVLDKEALIHCNYGRHHISSRTTVTYVKSVFCPRPTLWHLAALAKNASTMSAKIGIQTLLEYRVVKTVPERPSTPRKDLIMSELQVDVPSVV